MNTKTTITHLEREWDLENGFLGNLRSGIFAPKKLEIFMNILESIEVDESSTVLDKKLVSLIWYIPIFIEWQKGRFREQGMDLKEINLAASRIENILEKILGVP